MIYIISISALEEEKYNTICKEEFMIREEVKSLNYPDIFWAKVMRDRLSLLNDHVDLYYNRKDDQT